MADAFEDLVDPAAPQVQIGEGYQFSEGPVWIAADNCLLFSDIPGDTRWRWTEERGVELIAEPTSKGNGMCLDNDGLLLVCEHNSSSVVRIRDGVAERVAFHYQGKYLNSPNDVVVRGTDGSIYFTDPPSGRENDWIGQARTRDLDYQGVYRVPPGGGDVELVVAEDEFEFPNGLCFSPDESLLYINDSNRGHIKAFDVAADGSLSNGRITHDGMDSPDPRTDGAVDGMECDERGNIWTSAPGGVKVLSPEGGLIGSIDTAEICGSLCWGGPDLRTLFLTTKTTVQMMRTIVGPAKLPPSWP
jgi:gluconolactonase